MAFFNEKMVELHRKSLKAFTQRLSGGRKMTPQNELSHPDSFGVGGGAGYFPEDLRGMFDSTQLSDGVSGK
jgi:hypothetical protein